MYGLIFENSSNIPFATLYSLDYMNAIHTFSFFVMGFCLIDKMEILNYASLPFE